MKKLFFALLCVVSTLLLFAQTNPRYLRITKTDGTVLKIEVTTIDSIDFIKDPFAGHEYVDLGLPSGLLWATCNVGASSPEKYGDYFSWGETEPQPQKYSWSTYKYSDDEDTDALTKYCIDYRGLEGFKDHKTTLEACDDAASVNWGGEWRMPTRTEIQELIDECNWEWTYDYNGTKVDGCIVTSKADDSKHIFLPATGRIEGSSVLYATTTGYYWSSSLYEDNYSLWAYDLFIRARTDWRESNGDRCTGMSIRPVCSLR